MGNISVQKFFDSINASGYRSQLNTYTMKKRIAFLNPYLKGTVLDVGFGPGKYQLESKTFRCIGLDISYNMLVAAKKMHPSLWLVVGDAKHLPFKPNSFDTVSCLETIYYLSVPEKFVSESRRVLKKKGNLVIISINNLWGFFVTRLLRFFHVGPRQDISRNFIPPKGIVSLLRKEHFSDICFSNICNSPHRLLDKFFFFLPKNIAFILGFTGKK